MNKVVLLAIVLVLAGCSATSPTAVVPFSAHDYWILLEDMRYDVGNSGISVTIPAGFVTDYASIPRGFWGIASAHDQYSEAAVVHDYLYWTQSCTRLQADNLFMIAMKESGVGAFRRWFIHMAVRGAGKSSWDKNTSEFHAGLPRQVPLESRTLSAGDKWSELRAQLFRQGVRESPTPKNLPYCSLGDAEDVPEGDGSLSRPVRQNLTSF